MILSEPITIPDAHISGLSYPLHEGIVTSRITIVCRLTPPLAKALGCAHIVFIEEDIPREGFEKLQLDTTCEEYKASLKCSDVELRQEVTIEGDLVDGFHIQRTKNNEFRLRFRLHHSQNLHGPLAYVQQTGDGSSTLELVPKQARLFGHQLNGASQEITTNPVNRRKEYVS